MQLDNVMRIIYQRAWYCFNRLNYQHVKTIYSFEDLVNEGVLIYCEAKKKFDPSRGVKFSTLLYRMLYNRYLIIERNERVKGRFAFSFEVLNKGGL